MPPIATCPARFSLTLFGTFRLVADGTDIALRGRKACALLAYLALAPGQRASREHIADLLWTDRGAEQARASLRQTLAELRAIAGMDWALAIDRSEIAFGEETIDSDLARITDATARCDLPALAVELSAIEGDLLQSFSDIAPGFDSWVGTQRVATLEQLVVQSLACAEQDGMSRPDDAHAVLRALDRLDPYNEGVGRLGMRLDHAAGDSAALHRRYRRLVDQLKSEFDAPPAQATRTLFQQLTRGNMPLQPAVPRPTERAGAATIVADELIPSVIVAPLQVAQNTGLSSEQAQFCGDDMRMAISAMSGVRVLAPDAADIAALVADSANSLALYLLSGSVRDPGSGAVAIMQLANARDRSILWSASIRLSEVASPVEAIVAKAVGALLPAIDRDLDQAMRASGEFGDERAMYTRARLLIRGAADLEETRSGVEALERIVERNPRHLGAHLLLARMFNTDFWQQMTGHDIRAFRERGAHHLEIAARLAPNRVDVRVRRAWVLLRQGAYESAARDLEAVLGERQLDPDILNQCAAGLCLLGELARADSVMQQAFELNPYAPSDYHADYAVMKALAGRADEAEEHFLVSGESGLLYDAVRIANFAALPVPPRAAAEVQGRFVRKFIAAWQRGGSPSSADVIEWIGHMLPMRQPGHREFVARGLEQQMAMCWPAS